MDKTAIITGAGSGIGQATAVELSRRGFRVVLVGRTESTLQQTAKLVKESLIVQADVTDPASAEKIVQKSLAKFGRVDVLVNNAGLAAVLSIGQTTPQMWRQIIEANLSAAFYLCRAVWPVFAEQKSGVIVNISSMAARDPFQGFAAYGAAKAGLNNLGLTLSRDGANIGVRVYTIAPGAVETAMLRKVVSREQFPTENTLDPSDIARVIGQCVANESQHGSGEVIWLAKQL